MILDAKTINHLKKNDYEKISDKEYQRSHRTLVSDHGTVRTVRRFIDLKFNDSIEVTDRLYELMTYKSEGASNNFITEEKYCIDSIDKLK